MNVVYRDRIHRRGTGDVHTTRDHVMFDVSYTQWAWPRVAPLAGGAAHCSDTCPLKPGRGQRPFVPIRRSSVDLSTEDVLP